jgi:hypothetical protein
MYRWLMDGDGIVVPDDGVLVGGMDVAVPGSGVYVGVGAVVRNVNVDIICRNTADSAARSNSG